MKGKSWVWGLNFSPFNRLKCNPQRGNQTLLLALGFSGCAGLPVQIRACDGGGHKGFPPCKPPPAPRRPAPRPLKQRAPGPLVPPQSTTLASSSPPNFSFHSLRDRISVWGSLEGAATYLGWKQEELMCFASAARSRTQGRQDKPSARFPDPEAHSTDPGRGERERKTSIQLTEHLATMSVLTFSKDIMQMDLFFSSALKRAI